MHDIEQKHQHVTTSYTAELLGSDLLPY